jgi:hypothetical protein
LRLRSLLLYFFLSGSSATAHDLGILRGELEETASGRYTLEVRLPPLLEFESEKPRVPERCRFEGPPLVDRYPAGTRIRFELDCGGDPLAPGDILRFPWRREGAFVSARWLDGSSEGRFFDGSGKRIEVPLGLLMSLRRPPVETAKRYLLLGIEHILMGWDHLAFVLGLCLTASGWTLVRRVTGFTVGHSLTLAFAAAGLVTLPVPPIEACIALSIAFVAGQAVRGGAAPKHGGGLVLAFGLLHGLGFASALHESGIGRSELWLGLLTFNLGVEIGQLLFLLALFGIARPVRKAKLLRPLAAYALGALGVFWTLGRVVGFVTLSP